MHGIINDRLYESSITRTAIGSSGEDGYATGLDHVVTTALRVIGANWADDQDGSRYGADVDNEVFSMRRFDYSRAYEWNFIYKPTGFAIAWLHHIGKGMEVLISAPLPEDFWRAVMSTHPRSITIDQAFEEMARQQRVLL